MADEHAAAKAMMDEVLANTNWTFDMLRDPTWQPSREDYRHMRDALAAEVQRLRRAAQAHIDALDETVEVDHGWTDQETGEWVPLPTKVRRVTHKPTLDGLRDALAASSPTSEEAPRA